MMQRQRALQSVVANMLLLGICAIFLVPLFFLLNTALKSGSEFVQSPTSLVATIHIENFSEAWRLAKMSTFFVNSLVYAFGTCTCTCVLGVLAAYPISRRHLKQANVLYLLFLSALFLPGGLVPTLLLMKQLKLSNTYYGFIALQTAYSLPFAVFVFVGFISRVPRELDEAAAVDSCGYIRFVWSILAPIMRPAIVTVGLFSAIGSWNDFISPYLYLTTESMRPLSSGIYIFIGRYASDWSMLCASVVLVAAPLIAAYILAQRFIIAGLTSGAVKG